MEIFLTCVGAAVVLFLLYKLVPEMPPHKHREITSVKSYTITPSNPTKTVEEIEQEKEIKRLRQKHEEFVALMNYDVQTAYRKKGDFE